MKLLAYCIFGFQLCLEMNVIPYSKGFLSFGLHALTVTNNIDLPFNWLLEFQTMVLDSKIALVLG